MESDGIVNIITTLLEQGSSAIPVVSTILLILVLWYYRKDQAEWRQQTREDLRNSIQAIEKNTATLEKVALLTQIRLENKS